MNMLALLHCSQQNWMQLLVLESAQLSSAQKDSRARHIGTQEEEA